MIQSESNKKILEQINKKNICFKKFSYGGLFLFDTYTKHVPEGKKR